jgi:hypothetical protein
MSSVGGGFDAVIVGAQAFGFRDVRIKIGTAEHDDCQIIELGFLIQPIENVETVHPRHLDIEEQQAGKWIEGAIGVRAITAQVLYSLPAILGNEEGICQAGLFEAAPQEKYIVLIVLGEENDWEGGGQLRRWHDSFPQKGLSGLIKGVDSLVNPRASEIPT